MEVLELVVMEFCFLVSRPWPGISLVHHTIASCLDDHKVRSKANKCLHEISVYCFDLNADNQLTI